MRIMTAAPIAALALIGCRNDYQVNDGKTAQAEAIVTFEVTSPAYGEFLGDADAEVRGTVSPPGASLTVEGQTVSSDPDSGAFAIDLPVDGAYLMIDVEGSEQRERIPVFSGNDPEDTWPGGVSARVLPAGLDRVGMELGALIDATGWAELINDQLPSVGGTGFGLESKGVSHQPTAVELVGVSGGVDAAVALRDVGIEYSIWVDIVGNRVEAPISLFFGEIGIQAMAVPSVTTEKTVVLELTDADIVLDDPDITILILEGPVLEWVLDNIASWIIEPLGGLLLDFVLNEYGTIEVPEPIAFETDLFGTSLAMELAELDGDPEGLRAGLGVGINEPVSSRFTVPTPNAQVGENAQVAIGLHEGLLDSMLSEELLGQIDSLLAEQPIIGGFLGAGVVQLPGGEDAPEGASWCVSLQPGSATVVRMQTTADTLAVLYAPDFVFQFGVQEGGACEDWLVVSLTAELGVGLDGTDLNIDIAAPEGAVLYYGADDYDEAEVVAALADYIGGLAGIIGGFISLDDLLGDLVLIEGMSPLSPSVVSSEPLYDENGDWTEGLYRVTLNLWSD